MLNWLRNRGGGKQSPPRKSCWRCLGEGYFRTNYGKKKCTICRGKGVL